MLWDRRTDSPAARPRVAACRTCWCLNAYPMWLMGWSDQ